jgi:hypothetical protein
MTKLAGIMESAGFGKKIETAKWLTLFNLPLASLNCKDGTNPDKEIGNHLEQNLIRSICVYYGQNTHSSDPNERKRCPSPVHLGFIRQFALNLAVSNPNKKKHPQLMHYCTIPEEKSNLHRAYDAAVLLLGKLSDKSFSVPSLNVGAKARSLATGNFASMTADNDTETDINNEDDDAADTDSNESDNQKKLPALKKEQKKEAQKNNSSNYDSPASASSDTDESAFVSYASAARNAMVKVLTIDEIVNAMIGSITEAEFIVALQDVGKEHVKKERGKNVFVTVFPDFISIAAKMRKAAWDMLDENTELPPFLKGKLVTRVRDSIVTMLDTLRKRTSIKNVHSSVREIFVAKFPSRKELYALYPEMNEMTGL